MYANPYLSFNANCAEAFKFYEAALGAKIIALTTYGETPMADQMPEGWRDRIVHARMEIGNSVLMGGDVPHDRYKAPVGFAVSITVDSADEAERVFAALSEGGSVSMPIQETFWATRFGMCDDKFGVPWMINCEKR